MASISEHHRTVDPATGCGKCSKPMWDGFGMPAGFCDAPAYGNQTKEGRERFNRYVPALACYGHGGPEAPVRAEVSDG